MNEMGLIVVPTIICDLSQRCGPLIKTFDHGVESGNSLELPGAVSRIMNKFSLKLSARQITTICQILNR